MNRFSLAPMQSVFFWLTGLLFLLPAGFIVSGLLWGSPLLPLGFGILLLYAAVWFILRPSAFEIGADSLELIWPSTHRESIPRRSIERVELIDGAQFRDRFGFAIRLGAGGLWGGFGWLYTREGMVRMYISRLDRMVMIHRTGEKPLLLSPERPERFVEALS